MLEGTQAAPPQRHPQPTAHLLPDALPDLSVHGPEPGSPCWGCPLGGRSAPCRQDLVRLVPAAVPERRKGPPPSLGVARQGRGKKESEPPLPGMRVLSTFPASLARGDSRLNHPLQSSLNPHRVPTTGQGCGTGTHSRLEGTVQNTGYESLQNSSARPRTPRDRDTRRVLPKG